MIKEYFHIAHLISKHLSGEVTPEESRFLDKWRKESKSHEQLFQKICSDEHYAQHEIRKMEFDSQAGWKGVETRIKRMELRRRHLKLLRYVALFIAPVLILVFALQDISVPHVMDGNQLLVAHYSLNIFSEIQFYRLSLYISYLQMFSFGLNTHEISRF